MLGVPGSLLNIVAAIEYNKLCYYPKTAIKMIQKRIGDFADGYWDGNTIKAVVDWQSSVMRLRPLKADGMFGPTSLGLLIEELDINGHRKDAEFLRQFKHRDKNGNITKKEVVDSSRPVYAFFQYTVSKLDIRRHPVTVANWMMKGSFRVEVFMDRQIEDVTRYEYRQFIKGRVWVHDGYFGDAINKTHWQARAGTKEEDVKNCMPVPGGLNQYFFQEDGLVKGSLVEKFGYRTKPMTNEPGLIDEYSDVGLGAEYRLQDTFGIEGPRKQDSQGNFKSGLKVGVDLSFRGVVIKDGQMPTHEQINSGAWKNHVVAGHEWRYNEVKFVDW